MDLGIGGRSALVLAGGGGLGGAIATALAREGARVAVADISEEAAQRTAAQIAGEGGDAVAVSWDLADHHAGLSAIADLAEHGRAADILVNVTGGPPPSPVSGQDPSLWRQHFEGMVLSVIGIADAVLPHMRRQRWGRIITSMSSGVIAPIPNLGLSNALRSQLVGWSKTLAAEVGKDGVTCNTIIPGRIATGRITFLDEKKAERENRPVDDVQAESFSAIPLGRYGRPEEYAAAVAFLASDQASYITGTSLRVDGGYIASV